MATMKAAVINAYGDPDVFEYVDVPRPEVTDDTVLLRVHAAGINPVDWKTRRGSGIAGRLGDNPFPLIIGWDVSGEVAAVGRNVTQFNVGDEVYGMIGFPDLGNAYAEYALANPEHLALKPKNLSHVEASVIPLVALTSWQALFDYANLTAGQRVLIHAAAGGVGHVAVQLAHWKGAQVYGTASARNEDFLKSIGLNHFIDYTKGNFSQAVADLDVVYDAVGGDIPAQSVPTLKPGGFLVSIASGDLESVVPDTIRSRRILVAPNQSQLQKITELIESDQLKPTVSHVFSLEQLADAHRQSEAGHTRGKIAIQIVD
jgi:NADPH:quinone reductase-like Zn-dependent oxidoreductase